MVILGLFLLAGIDRAITPKKQQTIGKNVRFGLTEKELDYYTNMGSGERKPIKLVDYFGTQKKKKRSKSINY